MEMLHLQGARHRVEPNVSAANHGHYLRVNPGCKLGSLGMGKSEAKTVLVFSSTIIYLESCQLTSIANSHSSY